MSDSWQRVLIAAAVVVVAAAAAKLLDLRMARHELAPGAMTRYRVIRRTAFATIVFVGVLSALLVIPQVRAIAGGVLASSAVIGLVIGFASQRTIGNAVAGIMIAFTQPLRLGDEVEVEGARGVVEEIGLAYTWLRTPDGDRIALPNEKLASSSILNATIRGGAGFVEANVLVPLTSDLRAVLQWLSVDGAEAHVAVLGSADATIVVRKRMEAGAAAGAASSLLRVEVAERLRAAGVYGS